MEKKNNICTPITFKVLAIISIFVGALCIFEKNANGIDPSLFLYAGIYLIVVGVGLFYLKRIFAILFCLPFIYLVFNFTEDLFHTGSIFMCLLFMLFSSLPIIATILGWKHLK